MKKIIFSAASALLLTLSTVTAFADGPSQPTTNPPGTSGSSGQPGYTNPTAPTTPATTAQPSATRIYVTIQNFAFTPSNVYASEGMTVTWTNRDNTNHTVTSDTGSLPYNVLNSGVLQPGQSYSYAFAQPGVYSYHCSFHPEMRGVLTVTANPGSGAPPPPSQPPAPGGPTYPTAPAPSSSSSSTSSSKSVVNVYGNTGTTTAPTTKPYPTTVAPTYTAPTYTTPTYTAPKAPTTTTQLPNTGPAEAVVLFAIPAVAGSGLYYLRLLRRNKFSS